MQKWIWNNSTGWVNVLKKHAELVGSLGFHHIKQYGGVGFVEKALAGTNSSCEFQSQECFVAHDIFPGLISLLLQLERHLKDQLMD